MDKCVIFKSSIVTSRVFLKSIELIIIFQTIGCSQALFCNYTMIEKEKNNNETTMVR